MLGIIGLGRIGREVARRALGLDMKAIGHDPVVTITSAETRGIETVAILDNAAALRLRHRSHAVDRRDTQSSRRRRTSRCTESARVINCARGGIINEEALAEALKSGHLAGAASTCSCRNRRHRIIRY